jgi:spore germination protein
LLSHIAIFIGCDKKENIRKKRGESMRQFFFFAKLICILLVLSSCAEPRTLEEIGMITTVGYDLTEDNQIHTTMLVLQSDPKSVETTNIVTTTAPTSKGARIKGNLKSPKKLQSGQLRVALYGEDIAERGFINLADTLTRDHSISDLTYLAIVEGSASELLQYDYEQFPDAGQYVFKEIEQNIKGELIPSPTLHETIHDYFAVGVDPVLPLLKLESGMVNIVGMAILKDDQMVGKISPTESFYIKLVTNRFEEGNVELTFKNGGGQKVIEPLDEEIDISIVLDTIKSSSSIKLRDKESLTFDLEVGIRARLQEINRTADLQDPQVLKNIEEKIKTEIEQGIQSLITYCQSKNSDTFGFGEIYRSSVKESKLTKKKWHSMYSDIKVNIQTDLEIIRTGVVE